MKLLLLVIFLLTFSTVAQTKSSFEPMDDEKMKSLMVGNWVVDPAENPPISTITTYNSDGTLDYVRYETPRCEKAISTTWAKWEIKNGNLIIVVSDSTVPDIFPAGLKVVDKVVYIDEKRKELLGKTKILQRRIRGNKCLHGK